MDAVSADHVVEQVEALLERRRTAQARLLLKPALASNPNHTGLLFHSAYIDYLEDRHDDALAVVKQVLAIEPSSYRGRRLYFELLLEKKRLAEAESVIIDLLRDYPESADDYGRYARLMLRALKVQNARTLAEEGLKHDPDSPECLAARAICDVIEGRPGAANHGIQQLLVRHPESVQTLLLVVVALNDRGDNREAYRVAQELVRAQPDNQGLVDLAQGLKVDSHWSMAPLRPLQRWGWGGSFAYWVGAVVGARAVGQYAPDYTLFFLVVVIGYAAYSWIWPPTLRRLMK